MNTLFKRLNPTTKAMVNASSRGVFNTFFPDAVKAFLERLTQDTSDKHKVTSAQGVDAGLLSDLTAKVDQLLLSQSKPPPPPTLVTCANYSMMGHVATYYPFDQLDEQTSSSI